MSSDSTNSGNGYGLGSYGSDPYGYADITKPKIVSITSIDGRTIRVVFSESVRFSDGFIMPDNWVLESAHGYIPNISEIEAEDSSFKVALVKHTGTTLGCLYSLTCIKCFDFSDNPLKIEKVPFYALGNTAQVEAVTLPSSLNANATPHNKVRLDFEQMLGSGFDDPENFVITTDYPASPKILASDFEEDFAILYCQGLTSVEYDITIGTALAFTGSQQEFEVHRFADASGRLSATSTYRVDLSLIGIHDGLNVALSDSATQVTIHFESERIRISSTPDLDFSVAYEWSANHNLTLLRNQRTGHFALLVDGVPVYSTGIESITETPTAGAGVTVSGLERVSAQVHATASDTLYLQDGNFVHEVIASFLGLSDTAKNRVQVKRGPLTKGWGDATPAGINDVAVRVNGINVGVSDVNPYLGLLYLETPIPKLGVGEIRVEVDYCWFENPQMSFKSLNHPGLVLNKWDQRKNPEVQSPQLAIETTNGGSVEGERYPISLTLMRPPRVKPKWVSHRHIGFDKSYTASLNSPTALVLNANPTGSYKRHRYDEMSQSGQFEGFLSEDWVGKGNLTLQAGEDGYSTLQSSHAVAVSKSLEINPVGAQVTLVGRVEADTSTFVNDRLSVGPAIAFHDSKDLRLLAAVDIDGVSHIAFLTGDEIDNANSWTPAYSAEVKFLTQGRMEVTEQDLPELFYAGLRVIVPVGDQSGQYTVLKIEKLSTGNYWLYVTPDFPADPTKWGGGDGKAYFETPWKESPFNMHLVGRADHNAIGVSFTGHTSFQTVVDIPSVSAHILYSYGEHPLDLAADGRGEVLFGNLLSGGTSRWDFVRYITVPDNFILSSIGHLETLTLSDVPTDKSLWRKTSANGVVFSDVDTISLKSEGGIDQKLGFEKLDALIPKMGGIEVSANFQVAQPTSWGDAGIRVSGPNHDVLLATIPYKDGEIFTSNTVSLIGDKSFQEQGWVSSGFVSTFEGSRVRLEKDDVRPCSLTNELPVDGVSKSRLLDVRMAFHHSTFNDLNDAGLIIGMDSDDKTIAMLFAEGKLVFTADGVNYLGEAAFDWLDGQEHNYAIRTNGLNAELWVDGTLRISTPLADFDNSDSNVRVYLLGFGVPQYGIDIHSLQYREAMPVDVKKTLGIWKGGDPNDLGSWELPRTKDFEIVEMDFESDAITAMLVIDPEWGASLVRPDLPAPPSDPIGRTARHDSTGAWATVEWEHLPPLESEISKLHFGMQNPISLSTATWDHFRYRVYIQENEETLPPRTATLNRWNVLSSGEYTGDITLETVRLKIRGSEILISEANISAKRVFHVSVNGALLKPEEWEFDLKNQKINLKDSYSRSSVSEVTFSPGRPITKSYLRSQPLKDGITNLNEGTPPYLLTQLAKLQRSVLNSPPREDEINDVVAEHPDFESQDPTRLVEFSHDSAYSSVEFFQVDNGAELGVLSTPDDGIAPAKGLAHIDLFGRMFSETLAPPPAYPFEQGGGAPGAFLVAGGGSDRNTGSLGGGATQGAVTWASQPSRPETKPSLAKNRTFWEIRDRYEDAISAPTTSSLQYEMLNGGEYARTGPWGGIESLEPTSLLNGGEFFSGMVLSGGSPLPEPTRIRRYFDASENIWTE